MISKIRHYLKGNKSQLLSLYHSIFSSHMIYGCQTWGLHDNNNINKIQTLQNRALRLVTFADHQSSPYQHIVEMYKDLRLLKFRDLVTIKDLLFVHDYFNNNLPDSFAGYFTLSRDMHSHNTRTSALGHLYVPKTNSTKFGENSFKLKTIHAWNEFSNKFPNIDFISQSKKEFKSLLVSSILESYI